MYNWNNFIPSGTKKYNIVHPCSDTEKLVPLGRDMHNVVSGMNMYFVPLWLFGKYDGFAGIVLS